MNLHLKRICIATAAALCVLPAGAHATGAVGSICPDAPTSNVEPFAQLQLGKFNGCIEIPDRLKVLALKADSPFVSTCAAEIDRLDRHESTKCGPVHEALALDDLVKVDDVGGQLWLNIWRRGVHMVANAPLTPTVVEVDDVQYTIGYHTKVELKRGTLPVAIPVRYDVYLEYHVEDDDPTLYKYYAIEVFEDTADCRLEVPEAMSPRRVACRSENSDGDGEQPAGGGGEPPPK